MQERQEKKRKRQRLIDSLRNKAQRAPFFFFPFPGESLFDRAGKDSSYATVWLEFFGSMNPP